MKILRTLLDRFALRCVECGSWGYKALDVGGLFISNHPGDPRFHLSIYRAERFVDIADTSWCLKL